MALAPPTLDLSIVIPLYNENESLKELYNWITKVVSSKFASYEIIFVDDGSNDGSWEVICQLKQQDPEHIRGIRFQRNYGKSAALNTGFKYARGKVVITMDADLQDSPDEISHLRRLIVLRLWSIAKRYGVHLQELMEINQIKSPYLQVGMRLKIPVSQKP